MRVILRRLTTAGLLSLLFVTAVPVSAPAALEVSPVQHLEANGATLGYRTAGSGPPLVMIMGFGGTMAEWDPALIEALTARRTVVIFDNRGMGESTAASVRRLTIRQMARDTAGLIAALTGGGRADVLGWSMGGYIAQELAFNHPRRVRRLILAGSDAGSPRAILPKPSVMRVIETPDATPEQLVRVLFPPGAVESGSAYIQRVVAWPGGFTPNSFTTPPESIRAQARASGRLWNGRGRGTYSRLPRLRKRTLVAGGVKDVVVPPGNFRTLAERIPDARLRLYRGSGHAFLFQLNERFAAATLRFLSR